MDHLDKNTNASGPVAVEHHESGEQDVRSIPVVSSMPEGDPRPTPLTPAEADLTSFAWMRLEIVDLRNSEFDAVENDAAWRAGMNLLFSAWHQKPAGSLPNNERLLAKLAQLPGQLHRWREVRAEAMIGWILCDDDRWYHPALAEVVNRAWERRVQRQQASAKGNEARWGGRIPSGSQRKEDDKEKRTESERTPPDGTDTLLHRLPSGWKPKASHISQAAQQGMHRRLEAIAAKFKDFYLAKEGAAGLSSDWDRMFEEWLSREKRRAGESVDLGWI